MGYNGKRRPEEGHPCIGHRVQSERLCSAATKVLLLQLWSRNFLFGMAVRQLLPPRRQAATQTDRRPWSGVRAYPHKKNGLEG